jgi:serine phosphatase RsbU (regulator of sigma subunit)
MRIGRVIYWIGAFLLLLVKFAIDVVAKNIELEPGAVTFSREILTAGVVTLLVLATRGGRVRAEQPPVKKFGLLVLMTLGMVAVVAIVSAAPTDGFDSKNYMLLPLDYSSIFLASMLGTLGALYSVFVIQFLRDLVLQMRRKGTERNLLLLHGFTLATAVLAAFIRPLDAYLPLTLLFGLAVSVAVMNSFRLPWIVYLSKREKVFALIYSLLLFLGLILLNVVLGRSTFAGRALLYYSHPLKEFVQITLVFANLYAGVAFISTLFHLPTAEAFDRKRTEVTSMYALGRLINRVFDFNELVDTVTTMTMHVSEATSCWLELLHGPDESSRTGVPGAAAGRAIRIQAVGMKNITEEEIESLVPQSARSLRDTVIQERRPVVVDDLETDARAGVPIKKGKGSMIAVPLLSHNELIGVLYARKDMPFGFVKDDVEVISAFADQATVAIENSRLIKSSLERERLMRDILLAQEMQRKLLPQSIPSLAGLEIQAVSTPAFEVGGDYYDFMQLGPGRVGLIVGDVSGKGVSAAFYMSEVKGVFQALGRLHDSPREFMIRAHESLSESIDKHSFVSLLYVILDVHSGKLRVARAGHCPLLHVSRDGARYVRPGGMGLGLGDLRSFESAMEEEMVSMSPGDVCVLFTDGLTEARRGTDEFGYDRLQGLGSRLRSMSALEGRDEIIGAVRAFTENQPSHDDLTIVVAKWHGPSARPEGAAAKWEEAS